MFIPAISIKEASTPDVNAVVTKCHYNVEAYAGLCENAKNLTNPSPRRSAVAQRI